jgi:hypothetical protein
MTIVDNEYKLYKGRMQHYRTKNVIYVKRYVPFCSIGKCSGEGYKCGGRKESYEVENRRGTSDYYCVWTDGGKVLIWEPYDPDRKREN